MNTTPKLHGRLIEQPGCGHIALDNTARAFWQSRTLSRDPPELVDLAALARIVRGAYQADCANDPEVTD